MSAAAAEKTIPIRLPQTVIKRADDLLDKVDALPEFTLSKPSRSAVLRLAILRGLEVLEREARGRK